MSKAIALGLLLLAAAGAAQTSVAGEYPRPGVIVEPGALIEEFKQIPDEKAASKSVVILDVRPAADFEAGHIPGAIRIDAGAWGKAFGDGTDAAGWTERLQLVGLRKDSKVVVYDATFSSDACRTWWIVSYWGVKHAGVLNGGWAAWTEAGGPVSRETATKIENGDFTAEAKKHRLATKAGLLESLQSRPQVVDARTLAEHRGEDARSNKRAGCIPGARHLDWVNLVDAKTQRLKSADELKAIFDAAGVDLTQPVVTHCQSGGRSSVMSLALEAMGAPGVQNYFASWGEWGNADDTPVEKPATK
jgi:thiosulfate/3-mercaptopyruvate sulfurtransferase